MSGRTTQCRGACVCLDAPKMHIGRIFNLAAMRPHKFASDVCALTLVCTGEGLTKAEAPTVSEVLIYRSIGQLQLG